MQNLFVLFLIIITSLAAADQLQFEGIIPPGVDKGVMTAEYFRIYRAVAPRQRPDPRPLRIVYYSEKSEENFDNVLPEWGGGGAIGSSLIVVPTAFKPFLDQSFSQVTRHELVHAVLNRAYPSVDIPRWFHEGVAMTLSGELGFQENVVVSKAIFTGRLMQLSSIDSVNNFGRNRADLAYSQSHLAVLFLIDQYGMDVIQEILILARKTGSFWGGLHAALSLTPYEFEGLYRKDISSRFQLAFVFADYYAFWIAIVALFLVAFGVTIVRRRKKLAQMEKEENEDENPAPMASPTEIPAPSTADVPPVHLKESGTRPDEQIDIGEERYPDEDEEDDEYYDKNNDDDYILSDGVELENEEEDEDFEEDEGEDNEAEKKD
jgi:hypothetical protein